MTKEEDISILFTGYEGNIEFSTFVVSASGYERAELEEDVRIGLTKYVTESRRNKVVPCIGGFIKWLKKGGYGVSLYTNITPVRIDL